MALARGGRASKPLNGPKAELARARARHASASGAVTLLESPLVPRPACSGRALHERQEIWRVGMLMTVAPNQ